MALLSTEEAAKRLNVSTRRVRALVASGILKAQKVGRDWVFDEKDVAKVQSMHRPRGRPAKKK